MDTSKNATAEQGRNDDPLKELGVLVGRAVDFAEIYPERYRSKAFEFAFERLNIGAPSPSAKAGATVAEITEVTPIVTGGLAAVAREIGVDPRVLARVVSIGEDGELSILGRLDGRTKAELQVSYTVVYCYVKERALNQLDTPITELRELCQQHACYDMNNFTANFRVSDLIRELGEKGAQNRTYRLSTKGVEVGKELLKKMVEA